MRTEALISRLGEAAGDKVFFFNFNFNGCITQLFTPQFGMIRSSHLLWVVGHVWQHGGHVEHDLIALVGGVEGVGACGISWEGRVEIFF